MFAAVESRGVVLCFQPHCTSTAITSASPGKGRCLSGAMFKMWMGRTLPERENVLKKGGIKYTSRTSSLWSGLKYRDGGGSKALPHTMKGHGPCV